MSYKDSSTETRIAIWQRDIKGNKASPIFKGKIEHPDGSKSEVSLWVNDKKAPNAPTYTGVIEAPIKA